MPEEEVNNEVLENEEYIAYSITFNNCTFTNCTFEVNQTGKPGGGDPPPGT